MSCRQPDPKLKNTVISFDTGRGSSVAAMTVQTGTLKITPPAPPVWENHRFDAWYYSNTYALSSKVNFNNFQYPSNRITLYAKWNSEDDYLHAVHFSLDPIKAYATTPKTEYSKGETVNVTLTPADFYEISTIKLYDVVSGSELPFEFVEETPARAKVFSFVMPSRDAVIECEPRGRAFPVIVSDTTHGTVFAPRLRSFRRGV